MKALKRHQGRAWRFGAVGVFNTFVDMAAFAVFVALGVSAAPANVLAFLVANLQSYFLNARFTFAENGRRARKTVSGYLKFAFAHSFSLAVSTFAIILLVQKIHPLWAKLAATVFTFVLNYWVSATFVFKDGAARRDP